jgi:hypothetical protein
MTKDVKTEIEDQNIQTACRRMHENGIASIAIVGQKSPIQDQFGQYGFSDVLHRI